MKTSKPHSSILGSMMSKSTTRCLDILTTALAVFLLLILVPWNVLFVIVGVILLTIGFSLILAPAWALVAGAIIKVCECLKNK